MKIGLLGHGVVGGGVRKIIDEKLTDETKNLEITKILVKDVSEITDERMTTDVNEILLDPSIDVVVECMGGIEPARKYALEALEHGKHFVTSNKKMFASSILELQECAERNHVSLHYEATCGGGIPWIANIDRCKRVDAIDSLKGIFNGTTNYILSRMYHENQYFASMLKYGFNMVDVSIEVFIGTYKGAEIDIMDDDLFTELKVRYQNRNEQISSYQVSIQGYCEDCMRGNNGSKK